VSCIVRVSWLLVGGDALVVMRWWVDGFLLMLI
jgi:hypothetical protein